MMKLSAFADEISPQLDEQIAFCKQNGITHFELRGVYGKNVLDLDPSLRQEIKTKLAANGMGVACIGSPIGKVNIDQPWDDHFQRFKIAVDAADFFAAPLIRIFSYYPPSPEQDIHRYRDEVMRRMQAKVDYLGNRPVVLVHENERKIYGQSGKDCLDLLKTIHSPKLRAAFDFGNFVIDKESPLENWPLLKPYTVHIHIKDATRDGKIVPAGQGQGQLAPILLDLHHSGYSGFLSLEPHLQAAGQFSGFSGPTLFKLAVDSLKALCAKNGIPLAGA